MKIELTKEYLEDRFRDKKWTYFQIYQESRWSKSTIHSHIIKFGLRRKRNLKSLNLVGEKFGEVTVISSAGRKHKSNYWNCRCRCGNEFLASTGNLLAGNYISCGCSKHNSASLSKTWQGKGQLSMRYWNIIYHNAGRRGIFFDLSLDYAWELFEKQNSKCALTGWDIMLGSSNFQTASLDRIDSSKGYIEGNVQWVHKDVNKAKNTMNQDYFIRLCRDVGENCS